MRKTNAAALHSLRHGSLIKVGDTEYYGQPPIYKITSEPGTPVVWEKAISGVPYVKVRRLRK